MNMYLKRIVQRLGIIICMFQIMKHSNTEAGFVVKE